MVYDLFYFYLIQQSHKLDTSWYNYLSDWFDSINNIIIVSITLIIQE